MGESVFYYSLDRLMAAAQFIRGDSERFGQTLRVVEGGIGPHKRVETGARRRRRALQGDFPGGNGVRNSRLEGGWLRSGRGPSPPAILRPSPTPGAFGAPFCSVRLSAPWNGHVDAV